MTLCQNRQIFFYFLKNLHTLEYKKENLKMAINNLTCKLWITSMISLQELPLDWPLFLSRIYRFEDVRLYVGYNCLLDYGNLEKLTKKGSFKFFETHNYNVIDFENMLVPIDNVVKLFYDAQYIVLQVFYYLKLF